MPLSKKYLRRSEIAVKKRLSDFGISLERAQSVALAADAYRNEATLDHPRSAGGQFAYLHGTAQLRRVFCEVGWKPYFKDGVEGVVCHSRQTIVLFQNVHYACQPEDPRPASKKGPATTKIARGPHQRTLAFYSEAQHNRASIDGYETWFLCVGSQTDHLAAELSLPSGVSEGEFGEFMERIHIVDRYFLSVDPTPDSDDDDDLNFEVPITKKE